MANAKQPSPEVQRLILGCRIAAAGSDNLLGQLTPLRRRPPATLPTPSFAQVLDQARQLRWHPEHALRSGGSSNRSLRMPGA